MPPRRLPEPEGRDSKESVARKAMLAMIRSPSELDPFSNFLDPFTAPSQHLRSPADTSDPALAALSVDHYPEYAREFGPPSAPLAPARPIPRTRAKVAKENDDDEDEDDHEGSDEDDADSPDEDELAELEDEKRIREREGPLPLPRPIPGSGYRSPFREVEEQAESERRGDDARRAGMCAKNDEGLSRWLSGVAVKASKEQLAEVQDGAKFMRRRFAETPYYYIPENDEDECLPVNPTLISSLPPCVFVGSTPVGDGHVSHLEAQLLYMYNVPGTIREAFANVATKNDDEEISYEELLGGLEREPDLAKDVKDAGLYLVNPWSRCGIIGMTSSLGIDPRTQCYDRAIYKEGTKMGVAKNFTPHWPGLKIALMHHGATMGLNDDPVPPSAIYTAESIMVIATGSHKTTIDDVVAEMEQDFVPPRDASLAGLPFLGLNTNFFDRGGAFLRLPTLTISGARQFVTRLADVTEEGPMEVYDQDWPASAEKDRIADWYRTKFGDVFPPRTPVMTIYNHTRLRPSVVRRAMFEEGMEADYNRLVKQALPGKNAVAWRPRYGH